LIATLNPFLKYTLALAGTLLAYVAYLLLVVPRIEVAQSTFKNSNTSSPVDHDLDTTIPMADNEALDSLPADAWERGSCKRVEIAEGVVFFKDWVQNDDGSVVVFPFTLVIRSGETSPRSRAAERKSNPIVVRTEERAELRFDRPVLIGVQKGAKLDACNFRGTVHLYRQPVASGDNEAFDIWTSNVQMTPERIVSLEKVQFEFGPHSGIGSNLKIDLAHQLLGTAIRSRFETIEGVSRLELAFIERVRLVPGAADLNMIPGSTPQAGLSEAPIDVTCSGPFVFDFRQRMAHFSDEVVVSRLDTFQDQIFADKLTLWFGSKAGTDEPKENRRGLPTDGIVLEQIELTGAPARLVLPSQRARVDGAKLVYDVLHNEVRADDPRSVIVEQDGYRFESPRLQYRILPNGRLGPLVAEGQGSLVRAGDATTDPMRLKWQNHLTVEPRDSRQRIHLEGSVVAELPQQTDVAGETIDIWLRELPVEVHNADGSMKQKWDYEPIEVVVDQQVRFGTREISGTTELLKLIWPSGASDANQSLGIFGDVPARFQRTMRVNFDAIRQQEGEMPSGNSPQDASNGSGLQPLPPLKASPPPNAQPDAAGNPTLNDRRMSAPREVDDSRIQVEGNSITVQMTSSWRNQNESAGGPGLPEFERIDIEGKVFVRKPHPERDEAEFSVLGDSLTLIPQGENRFEAKISGSGRIESPQLTMTGDRLNLDQEANRVWVVGPGQMDLVANEQSTNESAPQLAGGETPRKVVVTWLGGMIFDGEKIYFEQEVHSQSAQPSKDGNRISLRTLSEGMSLQLNRRIDLAAVQRTEQPMEDVQVSQIVLVNVIDDSQRAFNRQQTASSEADRQPVVLEKSTMDSLGQQIERQLVIVPHVMMNVETGDLRADGPGALVGWQKSTGKAGTPALFASTASRPENEGDDATAKGLTYLHANFDRFVTGNVNDRRMKIEGNVRTIHGSVANWDERLDPDSLRVPVGATRITCDVIDMTQWQPRESTQPVTEVIASGNARVIGELFEATASRLAFEDQNGILTVEGDERNDANLWYQQNRNTNRSHLAAAKIRYRPADGWTSIDNVKRASLTTRK
jgi:hypothetical protein